MPDTFSALYVRTVGEQTISAEALQSVVARLAAQSAPATLDFSTADYVSAEFPALLAGNEKLGGIRLFENTTSIADGAFKGCTALARAVVPSGVAAVGPSTFEGCSALAEVTLPSSVASIADKAFSGCAALSEVRRSVRRRSAIVRRWLRSNSVRSAPFPPRASRGARR